MLMVQSGSDNSQAAGARSENSPSSQTPRGRDSTRYSIGNILLFCEALFWLALARAFLVWVPFRRIARVFGLQLTHADTQSVPAEGAVAARVGWAVKAAARRTFWESKCLAQALAAGIMLRRRRMGGLLYLGLYRPRNSAADSSVTSDVAADGSAGVSADNSSHTPAPMLAHAWLRAGDAILTGAGGHERYTVVARFQVRTAPIANAADEKSRS